MGSRSARAAVRAVSGRDERRHRDDGPACARRRCPKAGRAPIRASCNIIAVGPARAASARPPSPSTWRSRWRGLRRPRRHNRRRHLRPEHADHARRPDPAGSTTARRSCRPRVRHLHRRVDGVPDERRRAGDLAQADAAPHHQPVLPRRPLAELDDRLRARSPSSPTRTRLDAAHRRAIELAMTDALTGAANRRHVDEALTDCCRRAGPRSASLLLDIDDFKDINDRHGHRVGDEVLIEIVGRLRERGPPRGRRGALGRRGVPAALPRRGARARARARGAHPHERRGARRSRRPPASCRSPSPSAP